MKRSKGERILAWVCIILLLGLYAVTLIAGLTASPHSMGLFIGCLACTVFVPIFLHFMTRLYQMMSANRRGKNTFRKGKAEKENPKQQS